MDTDPALRVYADTGEINLLFLAGFTEAGARQTGLLWLGQPWPFNFGPTTSVIARVELVTRQESEKVEELHTSETDRG